MGRGRQKAKATRQAREIKYFSPQTDYSALQRELRGTTPSTRSADHEESSQEEDDYSSYAEKYSDYD